MEVDLARTGEQLTMQPGTFPKFTSIISIITVLFILLPKVFYYFSDLLRLNSLSRRVDIAWIFLFFLAGNVAPQSVGAEAGSGLITRAEAEETRKRRSKAEGGGQCGL